MHGTGKITIIGVKKLHSITYKVMPDRIEAGTFLCIATITNSNILINKVKPSDMMAIIKELKNMGMTCILKKDSIYIKGKRNIKSINVKTMPYPGFPTDIGPLFASVLTKGKGKSTIEETIFENRFEYCKELVKMNAKIFIKDRTINIQGPCKLESKEVNSKDLRGGAALVIAALSVKRKIKYM